MEVAPRYWQHPEILRDIYVRSADGTQVPLSAFTHFEPRADEPRGEPSGPVPRGDALVQPRAGRRAQRRGHGDRSRDAGARPAAERPRQLPGRGAGLPGVAHQRAGADPRRPADGLLVLGILYESYIHPITILSTLPSAGVGALLALLLCGDGAERDGADRHHPADRHRQEERDHDDRLRARGGARTEHRPEGGDLRGVPAALPARS